MEIAADQLADNHTASIELAREYWHAIGNVPFHQDGSMPSIQSPTDVFLSRKDLRARVVAIEPTLQGSGADWQTFTTGLLMSVEVSSGLSRGLLTSKLTISVAGK
jgi:hypothetical protein